MFWINETFSALHQQFCLFEHLHSHIQYVTWGKSELSVRCLLTAHTRAVIGLWSPELQTEVQGSLLLATEGTEHYTERPAITGFTNNLCVKRKSCHLWFTILHPGWLTAAAVILVERVEAYSKCCKLTDRNFLVSKGSKSARLASE